MIIIKSGSGIFVITPWAYKIKACATFKCRGEKSFARLSVLEFLRKSRVTQILDFYEAIKVDSLVKSRGQTTL